MKIKNKKTAAHRASGEARAACILTWLPGSLACRRMAHALGNSFLFFLSFTYYSDEAEDHGSDKNNFCRTAAFWISEI
jgi:hypothetical protein